jgi:lysophospholipase L1-like esterase
MIQRLRSLMIMVLVTLGMLVTIEVTARSLSWRSPASATFYGFSADGYGDLVPEQDSTWITWQHRPYHVQTNAAGLRNTELLDDNATRILAIGDSFTFGPYVPNEDTWPGQVERLLNNAGQHVQVLNAGYCGYTAEDELSYLIDKGLALKPDMVILGIYLNDVSDYRPEKRQQFRRDDLTPVIPSPAQQWASISVLQSFVQQSAVKVSASDAPTESHFDIVYNEPDKYAGYWRAYESDLRAIITLLQENNIPLLLVVFPEYLQVGGYPDILQTVVQSIAADTGTPTLDLLSEFHRIDDIDALYLMRYDITAEPQETGIIPELQSYIGNGHLSDYGYLVAAKQIVQEISLP